MTDERLERYKKNLQGEIDSASLYHTLAQTEEKTELKKVYIRLAQVEEAHATFWQEQIKNLGASVLEPRPSLRARILNRVVRWFGPSLVLPAITTFEQRDSGQYDAQPEAVAGGLPAAERSHARLMRALTDTAPTSTDGGTLAMLEGRHRSIGGNALRAAVLGANDGLASNLSLVMGVAGAALDSHTVLITGLAGLLAGACSMAMGEWLSVNSSREAYQQQIDTEASELEQFPEEEMEELALIYQAKGLPEDQAKALAERLISNKATALDTLVREELGINPDDLGGSAWEAAFTSFFLFTIGAIFPVAPFFFFSNGTAIITSLLLSGVVLFLIGVVTTLFTGRGALFSGLRQLLIGYTAAGITYGIGHLIGVSIAG